MGRWLFVLSSLLLMRLVASAQISYTGGDYTQNFDSLPSSGTFTFGGGDGPFALPNSAAPGWTFAKASGTGTAGALFFVGTGSSTTGGVYSFGAAAATDRALGTLLSGAVNSVVGVSFVNNTSSTITAFTLSYTGEQWRSGATTAIDKLAFEYQVGGTNILTGTFTAATALDFSSPVNSGATAGLRDGNDSANKTALTGTVAGLSWAPGQTLVLRWTDLNVTGSDDGLAIDDLTFTTNAGAGPVAPMVVSTVPADNGINASPATSIAITFNTATTVTGDWFTLAGSTSGVHPATVMGGPTTFTLVPATAFAEGETVTVTVLASHVSAGELPLAEDYSFSFVTQSFAPLPIHTVQGSGLTSAYAGQAVSVEGIVTATFQGTVGLSGFYVQAAEADYDNNPATSEGMFVFGNVFTVNVGNVVRVAGTVAEFGSGASTQTELTDVTYVTLLSASAPLPAPLSVTLPFASASSAESYEGMRVVLPQTLTVTDNFDLGHFGEIIVSNGRLLTPTNIVAPGAPAIAQAAANLLNQLMVDDGISTAYPDPTPYLADSAGRGVTRRSGSTTTGMVGILDEKFGSYIIEPTAPLVFVDANPRSAPPVVGGSLKVAIGNVLNLFNGTGSGSVGFPTSRGADTPVEFQRQRAKIIAGILAIAPDVMGLTEIENDRITNGLASSYGPTSAIADLVNGLNAAAPTDTTYAYVDATAVDIITDEIHCAFIYRVETAALVGAPAMLNHPAFNGLARNPLAQTFRQISSGEKLTITINHFKSKGSASTGAAATGGLSPNPNLDQGDGQGQSNYVRTLQAQALATWLATDPTGSADPDFLILGDLNANAKEDPIVALENAGYINLTEAAEGTGGYSYSFNGEFGHLDHALASDHLADQVVGAATWHVNADEPVYYDYNVENKSAPQQAINVGTPYRYSDHDPVVVGLNLQPAPAADVTTQLQIKPSPLQLNRSTQRFGQTVTVKNTSAQAIAGPVSLVITQLSANAAVYGATGYTTIVAPLGSPYRTLNIGADNILSAGETITLVLEFTNPSKQAISYTPKALAGPGGR